jgi:hypothetical protein
MGIKQGQPQAMACGLKSASGDIGDIVKLVAEWKAQQFARGD